MEISTTCPDCGTKFSINLCLNTIIASVHCPNPLCMKEAIVEDNDDEFDDESNYFILWT